MVRQVEDAETIVQNKSPDISFCYDFPTTLEFRVTSVTYELNLCNTPENFQEGKIECFLSC